MTVLEQIEQGKQLTYLARIKATVRITDWELDTSVGPTTYKSPMRANFVDRFYFNQVTFAPHSSLAGFATSSLNRYFFDTNAQTIYADFTTLTPIDLDDYIYVDYEVCVGSKEISFNRDPVDEDSVPTIFSPNLQEGFTLSRSVDGVIDGFFTSVSSTVNLTNIDYALSTLLLKSSLSKKEVLVYLVVGPLLPINVAKIFDGRINSVSFDDSVMSLSVLGKTFDFDGTYKYRDDSYTGLNSVSSTPLLSPANEGWFTRSVYGMATGLLGMNTRYTKVYRTPGFNNLFIVATHFYDVGASEATKLANSPINFVVQSGSTILATKLDTVKELHIGDELLDTSLNHVGFIENIDRSLNTVEIGLLGSPLTAGTILKRDRIGFVWATETSTKNHTIFRRNQTGTLTSLQYKVDYLLGEVMRVWIFSSASTTVFPELNGDENNVLCRVYGENNRLPNNGINLYHRDNVRLSLEWHHVLYEYLRYELEVPAEDIDNDSFTQFDSVDQKKVGLIIPLNRADQLPKHREVIVPLLSGNFVSISQNTEGKIQLSKIEKMTTADLTVTKDDILSISYNEEYIDMASKVVGVYKRADVTGPFDHLEDPWDITASNDREITDFEASNLFDSFERKAVSQPLGAVVTKEITTAFFLKDDVSDCVEKAFYMFGLPFQTINLELPVHFVSVNIGEIVKIVRSQLPGGVTEILARVLSVDFDGTKVSLKLWTQGGVQDSQGVF